MGSFANTLFTILLGWLQAVISAVWSAFTTPDGKSFLTWIGQHWLLIAGFLCVAGAAADLSVYIVRWKPFRVWSSFFSRIRKKDDREENTAGQPEGDPASQAVLLSANVSRRTDGTDAGTVAPRYDEVPDFSRWKNTPEPDEDREETARNTGAAPATVTNAGYVVPADSPYRRPAAYAAVTGPAQDMTDRPADREEREQPQGPIRGRYRKHRRINVSELFSDPEEELREYEAPQHIIDRHKAYHDPVYPRGWKKNEDDGQ